MTKRNNEVAAAAPEAAQDEGTGTAFVNATACVFNYNGRTVGPGGTIRIDENELNIKDKGLMYMISSGGLKKAD